MSEIYLINNNNYTFNLYNNYFANREIILEDTNGAEIVSGVTNTWAFKSGKVFDGILDRREDGFVYASGTDKKLQKIKIEFTPTKDVNVPSPYDVYMVGRTGTDLYRKMQVYDTAGALINPDQEKFIGLFRYSTSFNSSQDLVDSFTSSMTPAGLLIEEEEFIIDPGFFFVDGSEFNFVGGDSFNFVTG